MNVAFVKTDRQTHSVAETGSRRRRGPNTECGRDGLAMARSALGRVAPPTAAEGQRGGKGSRCLGPTTVLTQGSPGVCG